MRNPRAQLHEDKVPVIELQKAPLPTSTQSQAYLLPVRGTSRLEGKRKGPRHTESQQSEAAAGASGAASAEMSEGI